MIIYTPTYRGGWGLILLMLWVIRTAFGQISITNSCPATTVNLTTHVTGTPPSGTTVTWHTGTPATSANKVADASMVGAGTYYAAYFDATNSCYSPTSMPVQVTINSCGTIQATNACPATTVNLTTHVTSTPPAGTTVTWHTGTPATSANKVADATMVVAGTYYAAYFDATNSCYSPTSTPVQVTINSCGTIQASNICPATTVNLTTHVTSTPPAGTTVTWHTGTPATSANKVADATMVGAGTYYAAYFDATNSCYSPTSTPVQVTINSCGTIQASNTCPATTVNLTTHVTSTPPAGTTVTWHTGTPATLANKVADATMVGAGTYYAAYFDATNSCYSPTSTPVQVTINSCGTIQATNTCPATTVNLTTHVTSTPPAGTTVTWHTGTPATAANKVVDATMVSAGTYYAAYFDATNSCYSPTSTPVQATITICPPANLPPKANPDVAVTPQDKPVNGNVLTNDDDPQGGTLVVTTTPVTPPTKGTVTLQPDGSFVYTPTPGKTGEDVFCYEVSNAQGLKDTACVTVDIVPTPIAGNDAPVAVDDNTETLKNTPVTINVKANDGDPDGGDVLGIPTKISNPTNGTATVNPDGTITYTPNTGFVGTDTFKYSVCDNGVPSKCDTATVNVRVNEPVAGNQPPIAVDDAKLTNVNTPVSGTVASNDYDPDNNVPLSFTKVTNPTNGTVTVNSDGSYTYTPTTGYIGNDSFSYKVCDSGSPSKCDTATVSIAILDEPLAKLQVKILLQGALFGTTDGLMRDDLRTGGYLPLTEPYAALNIALGTDRYKAVNSGGETTTTAVLAANAGTANAIVDWVFVELRSSVDPTQIVRTFSALVQRDGDVVSAADGTSPLTLQNTPGTSYFVAVKHRNHLGAMTASAVALTTTGTLVDFTTMSDAQQWNRPTVGTDNYDGFEQNKTVLTGKNALWAGNAVADNKLKYDGSGTDLAKILNEILVDFAATTYNFNNGFGYKQGDINMDGKVKYAGSANDVIYIQNNVLLYGLNTGQLYNYNNMFEQLP